MITVIFLLVWILFHLALLHRRVYDQLPLKLKQILTFVSTLEAIIVIYYFLDDASKAEVSRLLAFR